MNKETYDYLIQLHLHNAMTYEQQNYLLDYLLKTVNVLCQEMRDIERRQQLLMGVK